MKEQDDILEQLFRENLHNAEMPVSEGLWTRIKKSIDNNRRKKFIIWLSSFAIAALASFYLISNSNNASEKITNTKKITTKIENKENGTNTESTEILNKNSQEEEVATTKNNSEPRGKYYSIQLGAYKNMSEEKLSELPDSLHYEKDINGLTKILYGKFLNPDEAKKTFQKLDKNSNAFIAEYENGERKRIISNNKSPNTIVADVPSSLNKNNLGTNKNNSSPENANSTAVKAFESDNIKGTEIINNDANSNSLTNDSKEEKATQNKIQLNDLIAEQVKTPKDSATANNQTLAKQDSLVEKENKTDSTQVHKTDSTSNETSKKVDVKDESIVQKEDKLYFGIYFSPTLNYSNLSPVGSPIVKERNANEKNSFSYLFNGMMGYKINSRIDISLGAEYNQRSLKYNSSVSDSVINSIINNSYYTYFTDSILDTSGTFYIYFPDSTLTPSYDTTYAKQTVSHSGKNNYQLFSIPITFSYAVINTEKWIVAPAVSLIYNFILSAKESWIDPESNAIIYRTKTNFQSNFAYRVSVFVNYNIGEKFSILMAPTFTSNINSIYKKSDVLKMKPYFFDARLGIRYRF